MIIKMNQIIVPKFDWKEVMAMKRFLIPRVAHCGDGHELWSWV
jgi:hypothetical protein